MKKTSYLLVAVSMLIAATAVGQNSKKEDEAATEVTVKEMVDAKRFVFQAQSVTPNKGGMRQLSPGYTLKVLADSVISDLPYFGRAYQASIDPSAAGIKFTSTDFLFTVKDRKKGGWDINIKAKDVRGSPQLYLSVFSNGSSSIRVISSDKESISFNGTVEKVEKK